ncbi:hypothetical protein GCM10011351_25300 [Paraliobacillus quinghaiensis]|uniref:Uncharacterized protein n=1 Tax=Paraliobacillus quinghaiensis TaxID=470815 RepID=A0A917TTY8_9BACI|nr:hypothetical protein [Paraliobacillus quinghaiensis]GGM38067.1 hypothetical protein GCM10011351_25300 [Paraliobacillus quinghaiensis]
MIGLIIAIFLFNIVAFRTNKRLTKNQIVHIWSFTIILQMAFDGYIDHKLQGYWYFSKDVDLLDLPTVTLLIPPVNMMFLNWYPFNATLFKKVLYYLYWLIPLVLYEVIALLPEPLGYFNYGWWRLEYSIFIDPLLLIILVKYYKWISKIEKSISLN